MIAKAITLFLFIGYTSQIACLARGRMKLPYIFETLNHLTGVGGLNDVQVGKIDAQLQKYLRERKYRGPVDHIVEPVNSYLNYLSFTLLSEPNQLGMEERDRHRALWKALNKNHVLLSKDHAGRPKTDLASIVSVVENYLKLIVAFESTYRKGTKFFSDSMHAAPQYLVGEELFSIAKISMTKVNVERTNDKGKKYSEDYALNWLGPLPWLGYQIARSCQFKIINKWENPTHWVFNSKGIPRPPDWKNKDTSPCAAPLYGLIGALWVAYTHWRSINFTPRECSEQNDQLVNAVTRVAWGYFNIDRDFSMRKIDVVLNGTNHLFTSITEHHFIRNGRVGNLAADKPAKNLTGLRKLTFHRIPKRQSLEFGQTFLPAQMPALCHNAMSKMVSILSNLSESEGLLAELPKPSIDLNNDYWNIGNVEILFPASCSPRISEKWLPNWRRQLRFDSPISRLMGVAPYIEQPLSVFEVGKIRGAAWSDSNWTADDPKVEEQVGELQWSYHYSFWLIENWADQDNCLLNWGMRLFFQWDATINAGLDYETTNEGLNAVQHGKLRELLAKSHESKSHVPPIWNRLLGLANTVAIARNIKKTREPKDRPGTSEKMESWRNRSLNEGAIQKLILGIHHQLVYEKKDVSFCFVLVAVGLTSAGHSRAIGVHVFERPDESTKQWASFIDSLVSRGLYGVEQIESDNYHELEDVCSARLPGITLQECQFDNKALLENIFCEVNKKNPNGFRNPTSCLNFISKFLVMSGP